MIEMETQLVVRGDHTPISVGRSPRGDAVILRQAGSYVLIPDNAIEAVFDAVDRTLDREPKLGELAKFTPQKPGHPAWGPR